MFTTEFHGEITRPACYIWWQQHRECMTVKEFFLSLAVSLYYIRNLSFFKWWSLLDSMSAINVMLEETSGIIHFFLLDTYPLTMTDLVHTTCNIPLCWLSTSWMTLICISPLPEMTHPIITIWRFSMMVKISIFLNSKLPQNSLW